MAGWVNDEVSTRVGTSLDVHTSVSPVDRRVEDSEADSDVEDGFDPEVDRYLQGIKGERIALEKEDEFVRKLIDPKLPTEDEIERHRLTGHVNYRNWCGVCVRARGKESGHFRTGDKERKMPEYSFDYCFPGNELGFKWTILVLSLIHI